MIHQGDCREVMKTFPDNHFTNILTDPPYGLSFMGKEWDHSVPGKEFWVEALRVCKPGAMMLCFGGTRTYHRLACAIEDAGWEIRDCLMWIYGSGFPKSHNHFGFEGYGTSLKPAYEPILLCMKPLDGTFAQNAEKWGVAGINIDACRIEALDQDKLSKNWDRETITDIRSGNFGNGISGGVQLKTKAKQGRWPANTLFDEQAAEMLDEQSGDSRSAKGVCKAKKTNPLLVESKGLHTIGREHNWEGYADSGGASRFFYCAKASSAERNKGCEELPLKEISGCYGEFEGDGRGRQTEHSPRQNNHPTVKPIKLIEYLLKLIAPPQNALILDPFVGSGTTCVAAKNLGIDCVGIELNEEYVKIAEARLS